jgi:hypothetical protein
MVSVARHRVFATANKVRLGEHSVKSFLRIFAWFLWIAIRNFWQNAYVTARRPVAA